MLHRLGQSEAVGRNDAGVGLDINEGLLVNLLGIDDRAVDVGKYLILAPDTNVISVAGKAVRDDTLANLSIDKG